MSDTTQQTTTGATPNPSEVLITKAEAEQLATEAAQQAAKIATTEAVAQAVAPYEERIATLETKFASLTGQLSNKIHGLNV